MPGIWNKIRKKVSRNPRDSSEVRILYFQKKKCLVHSPIVFQVLYKSSFQVHVSHCTCWSIISLGSDLLLNISTIRNRKLFFEYLSWSDLMQLMCLQSGAFCCYCSCEMKWGADTPQKRYASVPLAMEIPRPALLCLMDFFFTFKQIYTFFGETLQSS